METLTNPLRAHVWATRVVAFLLPALNPPPCTHTITSRASRSSSAGAYTSRCRSVSAPVWRSGAVAYVMSVSVVMSANTSSW
jgi:hypothetical protein